MQPRPYQTQAVENCREAYRDGADAVLLVVPTGGGKTVIGGLVVGGAVSRGLRVLWLAGRRELDAHAELLRTAPDPELAGPLTLDGTYPLPPVLAVADASRITGSPVLVADLADEALLLPSVWCQARERVL